MFDLVSGEIFDNVATGSNVGPFLAGPTTSNAFDIKNINIATATKSKLDKIEIINSPNIDSASLVFDIAKNREDAINSNTAIRLDLGNDKMFGEHQAYGSFSTIKQLSKMKGIDENGNIVEKPQVSGTYHISDLVFDENVDSLRNAFTTDLAISSMDSFSNDNVVVQTLDSTLPSYNPALAICLNSKKFGKIKSNLNDDYSGKFLAVKNDVASLTSMGYSNALGQSAAKITSVVDTENIAGHGNISYILSSLNELSNFESCLYITNFVNDSEYLKTAALPPNLTATYYTFNNCVNLSIDKLPESLKKIDTFSFRQCYGLSSLSSIPENVTYIGGQAFARVQIPFKKLPDNLTYMGDQVFVDNKVLEISAIPNGITSLIDSTFNGCSGLKHLRLSDNLALIKSRCFNNCTNLQIDNWPATLSNIELYGFYGCTALTGGVYLPGIKMLGEGAFYNTRISSIDVPNLTACANGAGMASCKELISANMGGKITELKANMFSACDKLQTVVGLDKVSELTGVNIFQNDFELTSVGSLSSATKIALGCFFGCKKLKSLDLTNKLTSIGQGAFNQCQELTSLGTNVFDNIVELTCSQIFQKCTQLKIPLKSENIVKFGGSDTLNSTNFNYIDLPNCTYLCGDIFMNLYYQEDNINYPKLHMRYGHLSDFNPHNSSYPLINSNQTVRNKGLGVILVNSTRSELSSTLNSLQTKFGFRCMFNDDMMTKNVICNDDPEWTTWNSWFDNGCIPEQVPQFPLNR